MKLLRISFLVVMSIAVCRSVNAQDSLKVTEGTYQFNSGNQPAFSIIIPQRKVKDVASDWKRFINQKSKGSVKELDNEFYLPKNTVQVFGTDSIIIYSRFTQMESSVQMNAAFTGDDSVYYTSASHPEKASLISEQMRLFAVEQYKKVVQEELKEARKVLKSKEDKLGDLEKSSSKAESKIKENKREISRKEDAISLNQKEQEANTTRLFNQKQRLQNLTSETLIKEEEGRIKESEKQKKKLDKENESLHKDIEKLEDEIKEMEKLINDNKTEHIPVAKADIDSQLKVVTSIENKLNSIK